MSDCPPGLTIIIKLGILCSTKALHEAEPYSFVYEIVSRILFVFAFNEMCIVFDFRNFLYNFAKLRKIYFVPTLLHGPEDCNSAENVLTVHTVI